jgi:hypothetical protein
MKTLIAVFILLSSVSFAQIATVSNVQTAGGFLDVCGQPDTQLSKAQTEELMKVPPSQFADKLGKEMANKTADVSMCFGYLAGLIEGWKEGHEHGVIAAQFPEGWPKDEKKALAALPLKQIQAAQAAMGTDVPCIPDYVTIGQERDILVKYIREKGSPFIRVALTSHVFWLAFQEAFPCPAKPATPPDAAR